MSPRTFSMTGVCAAIIVLAAPAVHAATPCDSVPAAAVVAALGASGTLILDKGNGLACTYNNNGGANVSVAVDVHDVDEAAGNIGKLFATSLKDPSNTPVTDLGEAAYIHVMTFKGTTIQTLEFREHHKIMTLTLTTTTGPFSPAKMTSLGKLFAGKT
jgi:hypothetical protein